MTKRREDETGNGDFTYQFPAVVADDDFLTAISRGVRAEEDELSDLLLGFREEIVEAPMPAAPTLAELGLGSEEEPERGAQVIPMRRRGGFGRSLVSGLVGAAAATLVIAGGGAAVYNAEPGSPLWGMSKTMFSERASVVELASTLDEMDGFAETGDVEGMRALLADARAQLSSDGRAVAATPLTETATTTVTVDLEPRSTAPAPAPEPEPGEPTTTTVRETIVEEQTLTETAVQTVTVTVYPQAPVEPTSVQPAPTATAEPGTPAPTEGNAGAPGGE